MCVPIQSSTPIIIVKVCISVWNSVIYIANIYNTLCSERSTEGSTPGEMCSSVPLCWTSVDWIQSMGCQPLNKSTLTQILFLLLKWFFHSTSIYYNVTHCQYKTNCFEFSAYHVYSYTGCYWHRIKLYWIFCQLHVTLLKGSFPCSLVFSSSLSLTAACYFNRF